jgi:hypothetical protein
MNQVEGLIDDDHSRLLPDEYFNVKLNKLREELLDITGKLDSRIFVLEHAIKIGSASHKSNLIAERAFSLEKLRSQQSAREYGQAFD